MKETVTVLEWANAWPAWAWVVWTIGSLCVGWWSVHRRSARFKAGVVAAVGRVAVLLLVAVVLNGPSWIDREHIVQPDELVVMIDLSRSMQVEDVRGRPRIEAAWSIIDAHGRHWADSNRRVRWIGFGDEVRPLTATGGVPDHQDAVDDQTRLDMAVESVLAASSGTPIAGLLLLTDGRTESQGGAEAALRRSGVPLLTVPLGQARDGVITILEVRSPRSVQTADRVPIDVRIDATCPTRIRLTDDETGDVLDDIVVDPGQPSATLVGIPDGSGSRRWSVTAEPVDESMLVDGDRQAVSIEVVDRPMRVLYIEDWPRWEYRYLKNMLVREDSTDVSIMLVSASSDFIQDGDTPISRVPTSSDELEPYDVVIIGDVDPSSIPPVTQELIRSHVEHGAGLVWIGGPKAVPVNWSQSPLQDLLPMLNPSAVVPRGQRSWMQPTDEATRSGTLVLGDTDAWPADLEPGLHRWSALEYTQDIPDATLKPGVHVLARAHTRAGDDQPVVMTMPFGLGQVMYVATDETWRWRHGRGDLWQERFWIQLLRSLSREDTPQGTRLRVSGPRLERGRTIPIELHRSATTDVEDSAPVEVEIIGPDGLIEARLQLASTDGVSYGHWTPDRSGAHVMRAHVDGEDLHVEVEIADASPEVRDVSADPKFLAHLSAASGGKVLDPESLDDLDRFVPDRSVLVERSRTVGGAWSWMLLLVGLVLLTTEWIARRIGRMA